MSQHYEVAVIGMQPAGLISGALLAKRGVRVLIVDHGEQSETYPFHKLSLPLCPTLTPSLDAIPHVQKVHTELGLGPDLRSAALPLDPSFQALMPQHRLDIKAAPKALIHELKSEFPDVAAKVERFFADLFETDEIIDEFLASDPPLVAHGLWDKLRRKRWNRKFARLLRPFEREAWLEGIPVEHPLRDLLLGPLVFFGHLESETPTTMHAVRLIARYFKGTVAFPRTGQNLRTILTDAAERAGADLRRSSVVEGFGRKGSSLASLTYGKDQRASADFVVGNTLGSFSELLPQDRARARYVVAQQLLQPTRSVMVVNLVVRKAVIPKGMSTAFFVLNGRRRMRGEAPLDPPLFCRRYPVDDKDQEREVFSVGCPVKTPDITRSPELFASLRQQIQARVSRVVPFLNDYLDEVSLPADTASWDRDKKGAQRRVDPWGVYPIYEADQSGWFGVEGRSIHTNYRNLVHCGTDVMPGLGLEGSYITGLGAADWLSRKLKRTKDKATGAAM